MFFLVAGGEFSAYHCNMMSNQNLKTELSVFSRSLGLDAVHAASPGSLTFSHICEARNWLKRGDNSGMVYMKRNFEKRVHPEKLFPPVKSVLCAAVSYNPGPENVPDYTESGLAGQKLRIARYARYPDYHTYLKDKLYQVADFLKERTNRPDMKFKVCVDSAPVAERSLAWLAGLGFLGKNRMLIHPELGPELFLGELFVDIELAFDEPIKQSCEKCNKCIRACPTGALTEQGLNANKCISYLTIEHQGEFDDPSLLCEQGVLFGCDRCVLACPYTLNAPVIHKSDFTPDTAPAMLDSQEVLDMTPEQFALRFQNTVLYRTGLENLKRNALAAIV